MANYNLTQTGAQVQQLLDTVAAGYIYMGTADLTTTPDTTNPNVCYLLSAVGTYTNFRNITHASGIGIALWNGTAWSYQNVPSSAVVATDATPTANSTNPVQSGGVYSEINEIKNGIQTKNLIAGLNTYVPSWSCLQNKSATTTKYGIENIDDSESPFADILGKGIKITPYNSSSARNWNLNYTASSTHPLHISFSYWVKKSEVLAVNNAYFGLIMNASTSYDNGYIYLPNIKALLSQEVGSTITPIAQYHPASAVFSYTKVAKFASEVNGWCQIIETRDIIWNSTSYDFKYGFKIQETFTNLTIVNPQVVEGGDCPEGVYVLEDVNNSLGFTYPENSLNQLNARVSALEEQEPKRENTFVYNSAPDADSKIMTDFDATYRMDFGVRVNRSVNTGYNTSLNFLSINLINKTTSATTLAQIAVDEIAPSNYNGSYMGGNHANGKVRKITTSSAHGKTFADIGSVWTIGTKTCTLVSIVDDTNLLFFGQNSKTYPLYDFDTTMFTNGATITHSSGATHTESMTISAVASTQWWSSTTITKKHIYVDGKEITESGTYNFSQLQFVEEYDLYNTESQLQVLRANVGTYTANPNPCEIVGDKCARHSIIYTFNSASEWFITMTFLAYQDIEIDRVGFIQQGGLYSTTNRKVCIPSTLPISGYDFRIPLALDWSSTINITSEYWANQQMPPYRWIEYNNVIGSEYGYLPDYGIAPNRKDLVGAAFYLPNTHKIYPNGITNKISVSAGDSYSLTSYAKYLPPSAFNTNGVLCQFTTIYDGALYVFGDYNATGIYEVNVPQEFIGRKIEVLDKSDNVKAMASIANETILISVTTASSMVGHIVLKIK